MPSIKHPNHSADPNVQFNQFIGAIFREDIDSLEEMLNNNPHIINTQSPVTALTPLGAAIYYSGSISIIRLLLRYGADYNFVGNIENDNNPVDALTLADNVLTNTDGNKKNAAKIKELIARYIVSIPLNNEDNNLSNVIQDSNTNINQNNEEQNNNNELIKVFKDVYHEFCGYYPSLNIISWFNNRNPVDQQQYIDLLIRAKTSTNNDNLINESTCTQLNNRNDSQDNHNNEEQELIVTNQSDVDNMQEVNIVSNEQMQHSNENNNNNEVNNINDNNIVEEPVSNFNYAMNTDLRYLGFEPVHLSLDTNLNNAVAENENVQQSNNTNPEVNPVGDTIFNNFTPIDFSNTS